MKTKHSETIEGWAVKVMRKGAPFLPIDGSIPNFRRVRESAVRLKVDLKMGMPNTRMRVVPVTLTVREK